MVRDNRKETYQDSVTAPLSQKHDDNAGGDLDGLEQDIEAPLGRVLTAIPKVDLIYGLLHWTQN